MGAPDLCGWLPWKALQEGLGEKVVAQEGEGEEGKEEKEDYKTNHLVTRVFRSSFACFSTTDVCSVQDLAETGLLTLRILNSFLAADALTDGSHTHDNGSVYFELVAIF